MNTSGVIARSVAVVVIARQGEDADALAARCGGDGRQVGLCDDAYDAAERLLRAERAVLVVGPSALAGPDVGLLRLAERRGVPRLLVGASCAGADASAVRTSLGELPRELEAAIASLPEAAATPAAGPGRDERAASPAALTPIDRFEPSLPNAMDTDPFDAPHATDNGEADLVDEMDAEMLDQEAGPASPRRYESVDPGDDAGMRGTESLLTPEEIAALLDRQG